MHLFHSFSIKLRGVGKHTAVAVLVGIFSTPMLANKENKLLPVEAFASLPNVAQMKLSPSGDRLGYVIEMDGRKAIVTSKLDGKEKSIFAAPEGGDFDTFYWANENIILLQLSGTLKRQVFRTKTQETRLYSYNLKKKKFRWLGEPKQQLASTARSGNSDTYTSQTERIVDFLPDDPKNILVEMDFDLDAEASVYRVNVENGRRKEIRKDTRGIQNWFTDQEGKIRYGWGFDGKNFKTTFRTQKGKWIDLTKTDWNRFYTFVDFTNDPNVIYVKGRTQFGTDGIYKLDLQSGEVVEGIFGNEDVDIDGMTHDQVTGKINGVYYTTDYTRTHFFDKKLSKIQRSLQKAIKDRIVRIVSKAATAEKYLILAQSDKDPGSYYLYDRENKNLAYIAPTRDPIFPENMASVTQVSIPARDGATIPGFMTMPNVEEAKNLPAVVLPHGGPAGRDDRHWDFWAQFYANRGYIVLQPNFRGSTGYGDDFFFKGRKQWGGLMQDDVTDATKWLISEGYADPERICIAGASYGGYAALMGPIKEQGLYKCAISVNGVTNLPSLKTKDKNNSIGGSSWVKNMGLKDVEDKQVSPHHRAEEIDIPVLIMSSVDDARINYRMSQSTHKKLKDMGKDSTYVKIEDGTHYMVTKNSRMVLLSETEKFLARHIGPKSQYASKDAAGRVKLLESR